MSNRGDDSASLGEAEALSLLAELLPTGREPPLCTEGVSAQARRQLDLAAVAQAGGPQGMLSL